MKHLKLFFALAAAWSLSTGFAWSTSISVGDYETVQVPFATRHYGTEMVDLSVYVSSIGDTRTVKVLGSVNGDYYYSALLTKINYGTLNLPETVTLSDGNVYTITAIGQQAFYNQQSAFLGITIPASVTCIGEWAFACYNESSSLESVTFAEGSQLTTIAKGAFYGCSSLNSIVIPASVTSIGDYAFYACSSVSDMYVYATTPPELGVNSIGVADNAVLYVPAGTKSDYVASNWAQYFSDDENNAGERIVEMEATSVTIAMTTQMTTFVCDQPLDFEGVEGLRAYTVTGFNPTTNKLVLTKQTEVPAGTALLLYRDGDATEYDVPIEATDMVLAEHFLKAGPATIEATDGDKSNFILTYDPTDTSDDRKIGFYTFEDTRVIPKGKAYLQIPTTSLPMSVKGFTIVFSDDEPTAIAEMADGGEPTAESVVYDLSGRRLLQTQRGMNIVNGKKVMVK